MAEEIAFENEMISNFRDLNLGSGHTVTAYRWTSLIDLYLHAEFHWNERHTYVLTYTHTDGRTFETHFIWSTRKSPYKPTITAVSQYSSDAAIDTHVADAFLHW